MGSGKRSCSSCIKGLVLIFVWLVPLESKTLLLSPELKKIECQTIPIYPLSQPIPFHSYLPEYAFTYGHRSPGLSSNWCGYVTTHLKPDNGLISSVSGCWTVPTLLISRTAKGSYVAISVGMDGYLNDAFEHVGTMHKWSNNRQMDYAWFQMDLANPQIIYGFPIEKGDLIGGEIEHKGTWKYRVLLVNYTKMVFFEIPEISSTTKDGEQNSAEWIVSAPFSPSIGGLPLASFGTINWSHCHAIIHMKKGAMQCERLLLHPKDGPLKAKASQLRSPSGAFSVNWIHE